MRRFALMIVLCLLLLPAGCGQAPEEPAPPWLEEETEDPPAAEELPAAFALPYQRDQGLDPITCAGDLQTNVAALLFEPLFALDNSFQPQPLLCARAEANEDSTVWTLTIRQGILFSDGSALAAEDVAATLRRAADSERYGYRLRQLESAAVDREGRAVLTLSAPNASLPALLDIPVVKRGTEDRSVPVGTGPYVYVTGEEGAWLARNDQWWQGDGQPLDRIDLVPAKDLDTAVSLLSSRQVQLCSADLTGAQSLPLAGGVCITDAPSAVLQFIGVNCRGELLGDAAVRRALSLGLQRERMAQGLLSGHAAAAQFPVSPSSPLYPAELEAAYRYETFLNALAAAGLDTGEEERVLTLLVNQENSFKVSAARYAAESLSQGDLRVELRLLPWAEYLQALEEGEFDLYYGETRLTADWDLSALIGTGGALNYGGYSAPEADALLAAWSAAGDREAMLDLCRLLESQAPVLPVCFKNYSVLTQAEVVEGLAPTAANVFQGMEGWTVRLRTA